MAQVIGEMSNKGLPHRKFVQTFILAEQPNGYYVLNDIFRYISDDDEDEAEEPAVEESPEAEPTTSAISNDVSSQEKEIEIIDAKLEEALVEPEIEPGIMPGIIVAAEKEGPVDAESVRMEEETIEEAKSSSPSPEEAIQAVEKEEEQEKIFEEKPREPEPTPIPTSPIKTAAAPITDPIPESITPPKPAAPKTWASMLAGSKAAAAGSKAAAAAAATASPQPSSQASSQIRATLKLSPSGADIRINATTMTGLIEDVQVPPSPGGWQTAGPDNNRKQHRQQPSSLTGQIDTTSAYIKNVTEKVDASLLKEALGKFGKLVYFDVSRARVR